MVMSSNKKIHSLDKMINSSLIKNVYPMVDEIKIKDIQIDGDKRDNYIDIEIIVDSPNINSNNMYSEGFDPHWLVDHYIKKMLPYLSLEIPEISFTVYDKEGRFIHSYDSGYKNGKRPKFLYGEHRQNEAVEKLNKFFLKG